MVQHERNVAILYALEQFWGVGVVRKNQVTRMPIRVRNQTDLKSVIVPFFKRYPLKTGKIRAFFIFRRALKWVLKGDPLTPAGLLRMDRLRLRLNYGKKKEENWF